MEPSESLTPGLKKYCIVRLVLWNIVDRQNPDHEKPRCQNCAATTHKTWECSEAKKISPEIVCDNCGNAGHPTFDCKVVQSIDRYLFSKANRSGWEDGYQQRGLKSTVSKVGPGVSDFSLSSVSIFLPRYIAPPISVHFSSPGMLHSSTT